MEKIVIKYTHDGISTTFDNMLHSIASYEGLKFSCSGFNFHTNERDLEFVKEAL